MHAERSMIVRRLEPWFTLVLSLACACGGSAFETGELAPSAGPATTASDAATVAPPATTAGPLATTAPQIAFAAATFQMGSNGPNLGVGFADHTPAHAVVLSAYSIDAYEVTVARYRACVAAAGCTAPSADGATGCTFAAAAGVNDDLPVTCVHHDDAAGFCRWDGAGRLPTEAEWEYAARGADAREYPWGAPFACAKAVIGGTVACPDSAGALPKVVGSKPAGKSVEGAFDLSGNVAEWVADWLGGYPVAAVQDPTGPISGTTRVMRGGGWLNAPNWGLGYARTSVPPDGKGSWGFRCAHPG
jgi:formylglycine-generating enzyme required for sulfatase activity